MNRNNVSWAYESGGVIEKGAVILGQWETSQAQSALVFVSSTSIKGGEAGLGWAGMGMKSALLRVSSKGAADHTLTPTCSLPLSSPPPRPVLCSCSSMAASSPRVSS